MADEYGRRRDAVGLGCGTLIIIALIVMFFSGPSLKPVMQELAEVRTEVEALRSEVSVLRSESAAMRQTLEAMAVEAGVLPVPPAPVPGAD